MSSVGTATGTATVAGVGLGKVSLTLRLLLRLSVQAQTSSLLSAIPATCPPLSYALTPDGQLFMANGLMPMQKWNGLRTQAQSVGVVAPVNTPVLAGAATGSLSGTYTVYQRFVDYDGNVSNLSPVSNEVTVASVAYLTVSGLDLPTETKVARRQILRNTSGQALSYYVELDSTNLAATSFNLSMSDTTLSAQEAVPLFDGEGRSLANRNGVPPSWLGVVAAQQDRMFGAGAVAYGDGSAEVTNGSATVQGVGTSWTRAMEGRYLYILGESLAYYIDSVSAASQTLTLSGVFLGVTDKFGLYSIRPAPAEKNLVYWTESGQYDAWPAVNALQIEETNDEITALIPSESFLFVVQKRRTFRLSFLNDPSIDGGVFLAHRRGCVNQRCWVLVEGMVYALDEEGIYRSSGNQVEPLSAPVQDLFWSDRSDPAAYRINWNAQCLFHCQHHKEETTVRWFVALSGMRLPRHALCFNYRTQQWWLEEYAFGIGGSDTWLSRPTRPLLAGPYRKVLCAGVGTTDGPDPGAATTRGTVTSATLDSFSDASAVFPTSGVVGEPVTIFDGTGKTQTRRVTSVSNTTVFVDQPWTVALDATSKYQLGAISWRWRGGWYRWVNEEHENARRIEAVFQPCTAPAQMDVRLYRDHGTQPLEWDQTYPATPKEDVGVTIRKGDQDMVVNLTFNKGSAQVRMDGHRDRYLQQSDFVSLEVRGVSAEEPIKVYQLTLEGAE